jgi:hypothetical protein
VSEDELTCLLDSIHDQDLVSLDYNQIEEVWHNPETDRFFIRISHDFLIQYTELCGTLDWAASHAPYFTLLEIPFCRSDFPVKRFVRPPRFTIVTKEASKWK